MSNNISGMKMFAEFLGTFILAASIEFITVYDQGSQSNLLFAILAGFFVAITLTREISGGHINPGVTLTVYLAEQDEKSKTEQSKQMWMYFVSQIAGATSAALLGMVLYNENVFKMAPNPKTSAAEAFVMEIVGSTVFYSIILVQGDKDSSLCSDKTISTLVITAGLAGGIAMAGTTSSASINPSLGFGFNFVRLLTTGRIDECKYLWLYLLGPVGGALLASYFYINVYRRFFQLTNLNVDEKNKKLIEMEGHDEIGFAS
jgi:glycerol uptake facilitator-like aquaporin